MILQWTELGMVGAKVFGGHVLVAQSVVLRELF
jgi:hypothetical protein